MYYIFLDNPLRFLFCVFSTKKEKKVSLQTKIQILQDKTAPLCGGWGCQSQSKIKSLVVYQKKITIIKKKKRISLLLVLFFN